MAAVIHIEINLMCLFILFLIAHQSRRNVNQQMKNVLFRNVVYALILVLILDTLWIAIDGHMFPGAIQLNLILNGVFLGLGVLIGCMWYLYVLDTLDYELTKLLTAAVLAPGYIFLALNIISIWTGWIFYVDAHNVYIRGPLFWVQSAAAVSALLVSLFHIVIALLLEKNAARRKKELALLRFYIIPVIGTLAALPYSGMPGTWTCATISVVMMYIEDQDLAIVTDGLTGLNNRKNLETVFEEYSRQENEQKHLYLFMIDLDDFKEINDTMGHSAGDHILVEAAGLIRRSAAGIQAVVMRYGGDEFLIMGFFSDDEAADQYKAQIEKSFKAWNHEHDLPFRLDASIGYDAYRKGESLKEFIHEADKMLYTDKREHKNAKNSYAV